MALSNKPDSYPIFQPIACPTVDYVKFILFSCNFFGAQFVKLRVRLLEYQMSSKTSFPLSIFTRLELLKLIKMEEN
jgi:hypothetical protein